MTIGDALKATEAVSVLKVDQATVEEMMEADLLVAGSPPQGFFITGSKGPSKGGEVERAVRWAIGVKVS